MSLSVRNIHLLQVLLLLSLVFLTVFILMPFQHALDESMSDFRRQLVEYLEGRIGRHISYRSISPAVFRHLEIRDLSIYNETDPQRKLLTVRKVRIQYNFFELFSGQPLNALRGISFENTTLELDDPRDSDLLLLLQKLGEPGVPSADGQSSAPVFSVSGRNIELVYHDRQGSYTLSRIFFDLHPEGDSFNFDISGLLEFTLQDNNGPLRNGRSSFQAEGLVKSNLDEGDFSLLLKKTDTNLFSVPELTMYVEFNPRRLLLRKIQDREPFDLSVVLDLKKSQGRVEFRAEDFQPGKIASLQGIFSPVDPWLSLIVSGNAQVQFPFDLHSLEYGGDLQVFMDNRYLPAAVSLDTGFVGSLDRINFNRALVSSSLGRLSYLGDLDFESFLPSGRLKIRDLELPTGDLLNSDLVLSRSGKAVTVTGGMRAGSVLFPGISGTVGNAADGWEYSIELPVENGAGEDASLFAEGGYYRSSGYLQLAGSVRNIPLETIVSLVQGKPAPDLISRQGLRLNSSIFLYQEPGDFTFFLPDCVIDNPEDPERTFSLQVSGSNERFDVNLDTLRYRDYRGSGRFSVVNSDNEFSFVLDADIQDNPYSFEGTLRDKQINVSGTYIQSFFIDYGRPGRFRIQTRDLPLPLPDEVTRLDINARGLFGTPDGWNIWLENTQIRNLPLGGGGNSLSLTMSTDGTEAAIYSIRYKDSVSAVEGNGYFDLMRNTAAFEEGILNLSGLPVTGSGWMQLASPEGEESYQLLANLSAEEIESDLSFRNAPLSRFGDLPLRGNFSGDITLRGMPSAPDLFVRLEMNDGEFNKDPFGISTVFALEDKTLQIREFNLDYLGISINQGSGLFSLMDGGLAFKSHLQLPLQGQVYSSSLTIDANTAGISGTQDFSRIIHNPFDGSIGFRNGTLGQDPVEDWDLEFGYDGSLFAFTGGPGRSISGTVNNSIEFYLSIGDPMPLSMRLKGSVQGGDINAVIETLHLQVEPLQGGFRFPFFNLTSGVVSGGNIRVQGPLNDPDFFGTLTAGNITATSEVIPEQIGPFEGTLVLSGKVLQIGGISLPVGLGALSADLSFDMEHWLPATYDIVLHTAGNRGVHVKTTIGQLLLDGYVRGMFSIKGDTLSTDIGGNLELSSAVLNLSNEELPMIKADAHILRTDLTFTTGRGVEFLWPSVTLPILRSFAKTGNKLEISSDSSSDNFSVEGDIDIQGGIVLYFQRNFIIKEGRVRFRENEVKFDPVISARAEIREVNGDGETVQIYLILDERPFSQFTPRFESVPSMSDIEIAALLGYSVFGTSIGEAVDPTDALLQTSDLLVSQLGIIRSFEQSMKEILNLDLFSIRTQLFQNILLERMTAGNGNTAQATSTSSIGRYLDNTTLFLGKYFGDDVFLEAMLQVQSNEQFFTDFSTGSAYNLETEISVEWKTPFFLLDIAVYPDFRDIVSSITTAEVGLSWSLSF